MVYKAGFPNCVQYIVIQFDPYKFDITMLLKNSFTFYFVNDKFQ